MSLTGRYVIDRVKQTISRYIRLPVPPYGQPNYWESSYQSLGPNDVNEWARLGYNQLAKYRYKPLPLSSEHRLALGITNPDGQIKSDDDDNSTDGYVNTSFGETIQVYPQASSDEPILIVGAGNSKLGEDMLDAQWRGPIIQVDISSRVCDALSIRCAPHLPNGNMQIVQDDATLLSAIADGKVKAIIDKGLLDAFFCADEYSLITDCLRAAHRVLEPGGCFVTFSFSQPGFFLSRLLVNHHGRRNTLPWQNVEIRQLDNIYLYRFIKKAEKGLPRYATKKATGNAKNRRK